MLVYLHVHVHVLTDETVPVHVHTCACTVCACVACMCVHVCARVYMHKYQLSDFLPVSNVLQFTCACTCTFMLRGRGVGRLS